MSCLDVGITCADRTCAFKARQPAGPDGQSNIWAVWHHACLHSPGQCVVWGTQDRADTIRSLCIGNSAHQKMDHLTSLITLLGFESVAVFGDCFDEVCPAPYPAAKQLQPVSVAACSRLPSRQASHWQPLSASKAWAHQLTGPHACPIPGNEPHTAWPAR